MNYFSLFLNLLNMTVENAAPYLLITIGGVFVARAGVFNISMEGCTEFAAFAGILFAFVTGQIWVGVIAAFVIAILLNCLFYLFTVKLKGNLSVVGSGINLMAACIPACLLQALYGTRSNLVASNIIDPAKMMLDVPVLRSIPILSDIFNNHTAITYLTFCGHRPDDRDVQDQIRHLCPRDRRERQRREVRRHQNQPDQVPVPHDLRRDLRAGRPQPFG